MSQSGAIPHLLFDAVVWSDRRLTALRVAEAPFPANREVRIRWHDLPVTVDASAPVVGSGPDGSCARRISAGYAFDRPAAGTRVLVDAAGAEVDVHPLEGQATEPTAADSLVHTVLVKLPDLWGHVGLHAACVDSPSGAVVIAGLTGSGKSTVSAHLSRLVGWPVLDDDAVMLVERDGVVACPLGGRTRLLPDAMEGLDFPATGTAGAKVALPHPERVPDRRPVVAVALLHWRARDHGGRTSVRTIAPPDVLALVGTGCFTVESHSRPSLERRLRVLALLTDLPGAVVTRGQSPIDCATAIVEHLGTW